jgi:OFA family oxalate/formate antiporter-like MFS transporter
LSRFFYGWVVVAVATLAMFAATLTGGAGFSVFIQPMAADLGWSRSVLAGALSLGTIVGALSAPLLGRLIDAYGARVALTASGVGIALTLAVVSGVRTEWAFVLAYGLARAIDMGALNIAATTAVANWFVRRRGRALGIVMTGNAIGVMLLVPLAQWIIDGPGWRVAWLVIGVGSGAALALSAALFLRRRPEDIGLLPDGDEAADAADATPALVEVVPDEPAWTAGLAARSSAFWLLVVASGAGHLTVSGLTTHQAALLVENGVPAIVVAGVVSLYGLSWALGSFGWGFVMERVAARWSLVFTALIVAACSFGVLAVRDAFGLALYGLVYGLANGAKEAVDAAVWADYFGRRSVGAIRGLSRPFVVGAGAVGSFGVGVGRDLTGSYQSAVVALGLVALAGAAAAIVARPPRALALELLVRGSRAKDRPDPA